ncbi:hypothetical protein [Enterobacter cloacae]|uniref:hypothetical protein n=1 Tax=Enterobacter cloacae TaxID=550 RepID=UPI0032DA198F
MKNKIIILSAAVWRSGGLAFAGFDSTPQPEYVGPAFGSTPQPEYLSRKGEQVTTNVLLRQILAEVMKGNAQKADIGYFITALIWVVNHAAQIREGDGFCFRVAWLESVRRFARQQQEPETSARGAESDTDRRAVNDCSRRCRP